MACQQAYGLRPHRPRESSVIHIDRVRILSAALLVRSLPQGRAQFNRPTKRTRRSQLLPLSLASFSVLSVRATCVTVVGGRPKPLPADRGQLFLGKPKCRMSEGGGWAHPTSPSARGVFCRSNLVPGPQHLSVERCLVIDCSRPGYVTPLFSPPQAQSPLYSSILEQPTVELKKG